MSHESSTAQLLTVGKGLLRTVRPHQWYKQSILLLGIVFSQNIFSPAAWADVIVAIGAFTAAAGATYTFNDIADREEDRKHPEKQHRPIASGQVPVSIAAGFAVLLIVGALALSWLLTPLLTGVLVAYLGQNVLYSASLKRVVLVDVMIVATGFVLRAIAGVVAIGVFLSPWLVVCTFLLALVLAVGKRQHEMVTNEQPGDTRTTLTEYTQQTLNQLLVVTMTMLLMSYALYTFERADQWMMLTLPFAFFGIFRYHHLVYTTDVAGKPEYLLTDRPSIINLLCWALVSVSVLYDVPTLLSGVVS